MTRLKFVVSWYFWLAVDLGSALAQGSWSLGDGCIHGSTLPNLRNFTTEQRGTTVLCVRKLDKAGLLTYTCMHRTEQIFCKCMMSMNLLQVVIMADGQVTRGNEIVKPNVTKVRRLNDSVISGFAGTLPL